MALGTAGSLLSNFFKPAGGMYKLPAGSAPEPVLTSGLYPEIVGRNSRFAWDRNMPLTV